MKLHRHIHFVSLLLAVLTFSPSLARGSTPLPPRGGFEAVEDELTELSLEELMNIQVTIASRTAQELSQVPGAVYVITGDELRRSGHTSIQEALRMTPGFYVSNWTSAQWDVTSRGFGTGLGLTSLGYLNQLLVLVDGVVVYSPLFAGTWWGIQDVDIDDIERIEIMRGPGGILWGSNAIHGVVHVITKDTKDTLGARISVRAGTDEWYASGRYGDRFGDTGSYRFFYRYQDRDGNANEYGGFPQDWYLRTAGARFDWGEERKNTVWVRGYEGRFENDGFDFLTLFVPVPVTDEKDGFQVFGSSTSPDGLGTFTAWISQDNQDLPTELQAEILSYDLEYKRAIPLSETSKLTAGAGVRQMRSDLSGYDPFWIMFAPEHETQTNFRAFVVHEWAASSVFDVTIGAQVEHNEFTDFEVQPTARVLWHPSEDFSMWSALTRSARTPSLEEVSLDANSYYIGDPNFDSEKATTFEVGARKLIGKTALVDLALFYNEYDDLHHQEFDGFGQFNLSNEAEGESYGLELAIDVRPHERLSLRSAYTYLMGDFDSKIDGTELPTDDYHPEHMFNLRSYYDVCEDVEFDTGLYVYDGFTNGFETAARWRFDMRLGWRAEDDLELFVGAQQINADRQSEFDEFDLRRRQFYFGMRLAPLGE
jgi:iron complex outermembrane receptor protein